MFGNTILLYGGRMYKSPIIIMSFNRPDYLELVLRSLYAQVDGALGEREVHLFQDSGFNNFSYRLYSAGATVDRCVDLFRQWFPAGVVHRAPHNLSVALNRWRAETYVFAERGFEAAYFLEDDMVLQPHYIALLDRLTAWGLKEGGVAYLSGYSRFLGSLDEQIAREAELGMLGQIWAVALLRDAWLAMAPLIERYIDIVRDTDYRFRDHRKVYEYYSELGLGAMGTSQDSMHVTAATCKGLVMIATIAVHARYIGEKGVHEHAARYRDAGFADQVLFPRAPRLLNFPSAQQRDQLLETARAKMRKWATGGMIEKMASYAVPQTWKRPNDPADMAFLLQALLPGQAVPDSRRAEFAAIPTLDDLTDRLLVEPGFDARYRRTLEGGPAASETELLDGKSRTRAAKALSYALLPGRPQSQGELSAFANLATPEAMADVMLRDEGFAARYRYVCARAAGRLWEFEQSW